MYGTIGRIEIDDPETAEAHWIWFDKDKNDALRPSFPFETLEEANEQLRWILRSARSCDGFKFDVAYAVQKP